MGVAGHKDVVILNDNNGRYLELNEEDHITLYTADGRIVEGSVFSITRSNVVLNDMNDNSVEIELEDIMDWIEV